MTRFIFLIAVVFNCHHLIAQAEEAPQAIEKESNTFIDNRDSLVYKWVKIGNQVWMAENLKTTKYRDGTELKEIAASATWSELKTGAYCCNYRKASNAEIYGALYNWHAVNDQRGLCPTGWHVPTDAEWKELEMYLGMQEYAANDKGFRGYYEGSKLKSSSGWYNKGNGFRDCGFSALPGGYRSIEGLFYIVGIHGYWWTSTEDDNKNAWYRSLYYSYNGINRYSFSKNYGFSVRCLKD